MNTYKIIDDKTVEISITGNKHEGVILIDYDDMERVKKHSWYIKDGNPVKYVAAKINNKTTKLHIFIKEEYDSKILIDHEDRNPFNNKKDNLRKADHSVNNLNHSFRSTNTSGRTVVRFCKGRGTHDDKFVAQCQVNGKKKSKNFSVSVYGYDEAERLAIEAREEMEKENNILSEKTK